MPCTPCTAACLNLYEIRGSERSEQTARHSQ
jgi:hypothetical protein